MKTFITIHHTAFADSDSYGTTKFTLESVVPLDIDAVRELAFHLTNAPEQCLSLEESEVELTRTGRAYSASVGDLIDITDSKKSSLAIIASHGFKVVASDIGTITGKLQDLKAGHKASGFCGHFFRDASK
jgi:hypothetical protein